MQIIGIIAEYNPIHNGHIYQITKIKELYPNSLLILITNTTFTQRGEVSIINKWDKTKISLDNQIDLIVELPFAYATQSADIFAKGALKILNQLKIDILCFGSESNDINTLITIATTQINNPIYDNLVKKHLNNGLNFPTAMSKALTELTKTTINKPNDLLAISYIKEIIKNNYNITPISIKRIGNYHGNEKHNNITNASNIRNLILKQNNIETFIPKNTESYLIKDLTIEKYFPYLKYKILTTKNLSIYQTVDEGIENRIKKAITNSNSWKELIQNIKTKRYTYNKISRMLVHILTSFTKEEAKNIKIDYIRILGFNNKGQKYLNSIKKDISLPIITNYKKDLSMLLDLEERTTAIYNLALTTQNNNKKPIIKKN